MSNMIEYKSGFIMEKEKGMKEEGRKGYYLITYYYKGIPIGFSVMGRYHGYDVLGFTDGKRVELLPDKILGYLKAHVLCHELAHIKFLKEKPESVCNEEKVDYRARETLSNYA